MRIVNNHSVMLQAHRGVCTDCPENTMAAFMAAVQQGYDVIELDPKFTLDNQCVVLHDRTINRTGRKADGSAEEERIPIASLTLNQARAYEYGSWHSEDYKGEQLPLLEEALRFARQHNMPIKIDNVIQSFTEEQTQILFDLVEKTDMQYLAGFTALSVDYLAAVAERFPACTLHYDGPVDEETLAKVQSIRRNNPLVVWLPYPNKLTSWCKTPPVTPERVAMIRRMDAKLGVWIIEDDDDLIDARARFAPDIVETTGRLKPDQK